MLNFKIGFSKKFLKSRETLGVLPSSNKKVKKILFKLFFLICPIVLFSKDIFDHETCIQIKISIMFRYQVTLFFSISYLFKRFYEIFINWILYIPECILKCNRKSLLKNHIDSGYNWIKTGCLSYFLFIDTREKVHFFVKSHLSVSL